MSVFDATCAELYVKFPEPRPIHPTRGLEPPTENTAGRWRWYS